MHFSYHGAGYALDPEYHQVDHGSIPSVMDDLYRVLERHYWDKPEKVALETPPGGLGVSGHGEDERVGGARRGSLNLQDRPAEV